MHVENYVSTMAAVTTGDDTGYKISGDSANSLMDGSATKSAFRETFLWALAKPVDLFLRNSTHTWRTHEPEELETRELAFTPAQSIFRSGLKVVQFGAIPFVRIR